MSWTAALEALRAGRHAEAHRIAAAACRADPTDAMAWHLVGLALLESGMPDRALDPLSRAASLAPQRLGLRGPLGVALYQVGAFTQSRPLLAHGDAPWVVLHRGMAAFADHDAAAAVEILSPLAARLPGDARLWRTLGLAALEAGPLALSVSAWAKLGALCPSDPEGPTMQGLACGRRGDVPGAIDCYREALRRDPAHRPALVQLGARLLEQGDLSGAEASYRRAADPVGLALVAERRRDLDGARAAIAPIIAAGGAREAALDLWARLCRRQGEPAAALAPLRAALRRDGVDRAVLLHALADTLDATGAVEAAFAVWEQANAARGLSFDPAAHAALCDAVMARWPAIPEARGERGAAPVFIVGMPRSGTSLLEQMLDGHPSLRGVGERTELAHLAQRLGGPAPTRAAADEAARWYRSAVGPGRTVDKMPHNFFHVGLIRQLFPDATILYSVRDPADTCFSCFRQRFGAQLAYATRLDWLGAVYRDHLRLMDHWRRLGVPVHVVRYAHLVQQPERTLRRVLAAAGLAWDPACLGFHQRTRAVATASFAQVQQPLYTHSIGRAAPYRAHLGPLRAAALRAATRLG